MSLTLNKIFIVPDVPHITIFPVYSIDGTISAVMVMITNNQTVRIADMYDNYVHHNHVATCI